MHENHMRNALRRADWIILTAVVLLGGVIRVQYLDELSATPDFSVPSVDARFNDYLARGMALDDWSLRGDETGYRFLSDFRSKAYLRPPGYPCFLALLYRITGGDAWWTRFLQMTMGLVNIVLAFFLGRRIFGRPTAWLFALFMAVYWAFVYFEGQLQEPALLVFLLLCLGHVFARLSSCVSAFPAFLAGVLVGLFALVRPNMLLFLPALIGWLWLRTGYLPAGRRLRAAVLSVCLGAGLAVMPSAIRNAVLARDAVLISSNAGINLYLGNNEASTGFFVSDAPLVRSFESCFDYPRIVRELEGRLGRTMAHSEVSAWYARQALRYIGSNPIEFAGLTLKRFILFWSPQEIGHNREIHCDRLHSGVLRNLPGDFASVLALAIVGFAAIAADSRRRKEDIASRLQAHRQAGFAAITACLALTYALSFSVFFVVGMFRVPVVVILLLFAAHAVVRLVRLFAERRFRCAVVLSAMLLIVGGLTRIPWIRCDPDWTKWRYDRGLGAHLTGQTDRAIQEYRKTLLLCPDHEDAHTNLGLMLAEREDFKAAAAHFLTALKAKPYDLLSLKGMGYCLLQTGRDEEAEKVLR
ncbi:MAG: glycosyltransferase family 39 protein, partial [Verrucomicrobiota bacterium]